MFNEKVSKKFLSSYKKSICQIVISNEYKINSFFLQFKIKTKRYYFLICPYDDILKKEITSQIKYINILVNTKKFEINLNPKERIIKCLDDEKIIAIEIFNSDKISKAIEFLYCDLNYVYGYNTYKGQHIFVLNYGDANTYGGIIEEINDSNFKYSSKFSQNIFLPIFLSGNSRIIGIHINNEDKYKIGTFIGNLIKTFNESQYRRELKINLNTLYKLSKSLCILKNIDANSEVDEYSNLGLYLGKGIEKDREYIGFFIYLGKDLNFLLTEYSIDENSIGKKDTYEIKIYNNKLFYIKLDRNERIIRHTTKFTIIQILNKDEVKKEIDFLMPELNYNDFYDYKDKEILILNLKKRKLVTKYGNSPPNNNVNNYKYRCEISKIIKIPYEKKNDSFFAKENFEIESSEKPLGEFGNGRGIVILIENLKAFGIIDLYGKLGTEIYITINEIQNNIFNYENKILIGSKLSLKSINNVSKSMCKVNFGPISFIGFFVKICLKRDYYFLITKCLIEFILENKFSFSINLISGKEYWIKYNEKRIMAEIHFSIGIIEILDSDEIKNDIYFLSCDLDYFKKYNEYSNKNIFLLRYSTNFDDINIANGKILKKDICHFFYISDIGPNCDGAPVLLSENSKVIGRHSMQADYGESIFYGSQLDLDNFFE